MAVNMNWVIPNNKRMFMKKILFSSIIFFSLGTAAQNDKTQQADSVEIRFAELPDSTAMGSADGNPTSKEIDPSGGRIVSEDGRVELIFPDGALTKTTNISIHPIVNLVPNGNGKGYRFEPSGIHFAKPVELNFHYTIEDEQRCPALLQFMAIQNDNGKWDYMDYEDWDSAARILKGRITHFSAMVDGNMVDLGPSEATLRCGKKQTFFLSIVKEPEKSTKTQSSGDELPALPTADVSLSMKDARWYVNNIRNGNTTVGTINVDPTQQQGRVRATYSAPNSLTNDKWIAIKLKLDIYIKAPGYRKSTANRRGKLTSFWETKLDRTEEFTAKVHLYDEYKVSLKDYAEPRPEMGTFIFSSGSFTVRVDQDNIDIDDQQIDPPSVVKEHAAPKPFKVTVDISGSKGSVNLDRLVGKGRSYTEDENGSLAIALQFASDQVYAGKVTFGARGMPPSEPTMFYMYSMPRDIKFNANGQSQIIEKSSIKEVPYRILVEPVRGD
jgi:hypothetical protein